MKSNRSYILKSRCPRVRVRNERGVMSLTVAAMILLVITLVGTVSILLYSGVAGYYQGKLAFVADQAAHYAAGQYCWNQSIQTNNNYQASTQNMVSGVLSDMSLPAGTATVAVSGSGSGSEMTSSLSVNGFVMPGNAQFLPGTINMQASSNYDLSGNQPQMLVAFSFANDPQNRVVLCPAAGWNVPHEYGSLPDPMAADITPFGPNTPWIVSEIYFPSSTTQMEYSQGPVP